LTDKSFIRRGVIVIK